MTFSIVARDANNGRFGVAVATCHLAVGSTVPHIRSGVGAVATQAHTNPYLGICGLERLEQCADAHRVLETLLVDDNHRDCRQFHLIDHQGRTACWTGPDCEDWAGHRHGQDCSVAGNFLVGESVLVAMEMAFQTSDPTWKLGRRLMHALQISGDAAFPLHSQDLWAQPWRDELSELCTLNRTIQRSYERPRSAS